jgi:nicotinate phosphoribosyltransferase
VIEFGLRRAQGIDGALSAARAAYIGGAVATSNVLAGKLLGIPVRGTHAHSWVMSFDDELEAFRAYARAMPANVVLLVDTYDTLNGVRHAIEIGRELRASGHELLGIRLDSGDLAWLSIEARKLLDAAGFEKAQILATNDLDENIIDSLKAQGARIVSWGVGTRLVTAFDEPALGGIYKLAAIREGDGWSPRIKISEQTAKTSIPGILQVRRFSVGAEFRGDLIYDVTTGPPGAVLVDPLDPTRRKGMPEGAAGEDLLVPVVRNGEAVYEAPALEAVRARTQAQLAQLHPAIKRLVNPHLYPVGLEPSLHERRTRMILEARQRN